MGTAPAITLQPISQRIMLAAGASLVVAASGDSPLSYQWYLAKMYGQEAAQLLDGKTSATIAISNFTYDAEGQYYCIVTNPSGSAQSAPAIVKAAIGQLDEKYLQRRLAEWINSIFLLWDGTGTQPPGTVAMIWHMQTNTRFPTPFLMGRISAIGRVGRDAVFPPDDAGKRRQAGARGFMLYLQFFGPEALTALSKIYDASDDGECTAVLRADGIVPIERQDVIDAHAFVDTMPEDRAMLDIRFYTTSEWFTQIDVIESVDMTGEIVLEDATKQEVEIST
ncbi:MAG TPA: immunoglobulin domain-containing protein [Chitinivibrionales bacterium]|nr:immunoglobulin domain-containing protein [Chitinivibrionales bacterium]